MKHRLILLLFSLALWPNRVFGDPVADELKTLKSQVKALLERIEVLENKQKNMPISQTPSPKEQKTSQEKLPVRSGTQNIKVALSGQVNRALLYGDNGRSSRLQHVDNNNSSSRFRLEGTGELTKDFSVQGKIEGEILSNSSMDVDLTDSSAAGRTIGWTQRHLEAILKSKTYGTLFLGRGAMASTDTSEVDLSKTEVIALGGTANLMAGGLSFVTPSGAKGPRIKEVYTGFDGLSRIDRIRYDTPAFHGFFLGFAQGSGEQNDVSLKFAGEYEKTQMQMALSYGNSRPSKMKQYNGSGSILFSSGISLTVAGGQQKLDDISRYRGYFALGKVGYQKRWFELGITALAVDFGQSWNVAQNKDKSYLYGAFLVQHIEKIAMEIYLGVRNHHLDRSAQTYGDILAVAFGTRLKF